MGNVFFNCRKPVKSIETKPVRCHICSQDHGNKEENFKHTIKSVLERNETIGG